MSKFGLSLIDATIQTYLEDRSIAKHTFRDFNLRMTSMYIPMPETKVQTVDLPFASGSVDLTEAGGITPYADRKGLSFEFIFFGDLMHWPIMIHDLANFLHGKKILMIPDNDLEHYYIVRLALDSKKTSKHANKVVLEGTSDPFKYALLDTHDPWLWDPFSFVDGEITSLSDIIVDGTTQITIPAGGLPNCPTFIVTQAGAGLGIQYTSSASASRIFQMPATGTYSFPQIRAGGPTDTVITFVGKGRISIAYRKKYL